MGAEVEMEYANDQIAIELVRITNSLLTLLLTFAAIVCKPKTT